MSKVFEKKNVVDEKKEEPKVHGLPEKTIKFIAESFNEQAKENILLEAEVAEKQKVIGEKLNGKLTGVLVSAIASAGLDGNWGFSKDYKNLVKIEN